MENKIEKWLEERAENIKDIWKNVTRWRLEKCKSPIEKLFLIEWYFQVEDENSVPEGYKNFYIYPQCQINNYRIDFVVVFQTEKYILANRENLEKLKEEILLVEIDSYLWHGSNPEQFTKEKERERELIKNDYKLMRFSGREIYSNVTKCVNEVFAYFLKDDEYRLENLKE
jgi:hypothetical protein